VLFCFLADSTDHVSTVSALADFFSAASFSASEGSGVISRFFKCAMPLSKDESLLANRNDLELTNQK